MFAPTNSNYFVHLFRKYKAYFILKIIKNKIKNDLKMNILIMKLNHKVCYLGINRS